MDTITQTNCLLQKYAGPIEGLFFQNVDKLRQSPTRVKKTKKQITKNLHTAPTHPLPKTKELHQTTNPPALRSNGSGTRLSTFFSYLLQMLPCTDTLSLLP